MNLRAISLFLAMIVFSAFSPSVSSAVMRDMPDDSHLRVHVGDSAPLDMDYLKHIHDQGQAIVLMFGNSDICITCEHTWGKLESLAPKYDKVAVIPIGHYSAHGWTVVNKEEETLAKTFGVEGEPWVFLIDSKGVVRHIFKGMAGLSDLDAEMAKLQDEAGHGPSVH